MMKTFACLVLIGLLAVVQGDYLDCTYTTTDLSGTSFFYSLSSLEATIFNESLSGISTKLSFSVCTSLNAIDPELLCEDGSAACYFPTPDDQSVSGINIGNWENTLFSDSELGPDQGVELVYSSPNSSFCDSNGRRYKTVLKINCLADEEFIIQSIQNPSSCDTIITAQSMHACPTAVGGSGMFVDGVGSFRSRKCSGKKLGLVIFGLATICCCCCVCCIRRRRRCAMLRKQKEQQAAVELTNVSFQSVPQQQQTQVQLQMTPQFMYPQQQFAPQYFYVQPPQVQPSQVELQPVVVRDNQVDADEKLAKALQAHFDQE